MTREQLVKECYDARAKSWKDWTWHIRFGMCMAIAMMLTAVLVVALSIHLERYNLLAHAFMLLVVSGVMWFVRMQSIKNRSHFFSKFTELAEKANANSYE